MDTPPLAFGLLLAAAPVCFCCIEFNRSNRLAQSADQRRNRIARPLLSRPAASFKSLTRLDISIAGPIGEIGCNRFCYQMCISAVRTKRHGPSVNAKPPQIATARRAFSLSIVPVWTASVELVLAFRSKSLARPICQREINRAQNL